MGSNFTCKLVLLGDGRVEKTSLVSRYVNNVFSEKQEATVQASYLTKRLAIGGVPITLSIWAVAGYGWTGTCPCPGPYILLRCRWHAPYKLISDSSMSSAYSPLVSDITDSVTFIRVRKWVKELQQMASKDIVMAIAANNNDLVRSKKYDIQEDGSYATSIGAKLFVTSAKSGTGIDEVFLDIATQERKLTVACSAKIRDSCYS